MLLLAEEGVAAVEGGENGRCLSSLVARILRKSFLTADPSVDAACDNESFGADFDALSDNGVLVAMPFSLLVETGCIRSLDELSPSGVIAALSAARRSDARLSCCSLPLACGRDVAGEVESFANSSGFSALPLP